MKMAGYSEEEFQAFIKKNRELIESMMSLQKEAAVSAASAGRDMAHEAASDAAEVADKARQKAEEFVQTTYSMATDPEVQRHFMNMGMEFMAGVSTLMKKAPMPDFVKDAAAGTEQTWKQSACRNNEECAAKKARAQRVKVEVTDDPEAPRKDIPKDIVVTDYTKTE